MLPFSMRRQGEGAAAPFPFTPIPAKPAFASLRKAQEHESHLTIPITSSTIKPPASLRSDRLIGFDKISDRFQTGTLIAFAGICTLTPSNRYGVVEHSG